MIFEVPMIINYFIFYFSQMIKEALLMVESMASSSTPSNGTEWFRLVRHLFLPFTTDIQIFFSV